MAAITPGVLASFEQVDAACDAIRDLRAKGRKDFTVFVSHPNHEIEEAAGHTTSPVRLFTLIGGLTGLAAAISMQVWMNRDWPVLVGGKAIVAMPAFVVIMFELTVLVASLVTLAGVALLATALRKKGVKYDERFSDDRIGIFVPAAQDQAAATERFLRDAGAVAVEVQHAA